MSESKADDVVILPRPFKLRIEANAAAGKKVSTLKILYLFLRLILGPPWKLSEGINLS